MHIASTFRNDTAAGLRIPCRRKCADLRCGRSHWLCGCVCICGADRCNPNAHGESRSLTERSENYAINSARDR